MFSYGNKVSVMVLMKALKEFRKLSGLVPSIEKSTTLFSNVGELEKQAIIDILPFDEGSFPIKYKGVPLISTRLLHKDCQVLVERVRNKINNWKNKSLSTAGRLQLVISVLSSMHVCWSSEFILPNYDSKEIEKMLLGFL